MLENLLQNYEIVEFSIQNLDYLTESQCEIRQDLMTKRDEWANQIFSISIACCMYISTLIPHELEIGVQCLKNIWRLCNEEINSKLTAIDEKEADADFNAEIETRKNELIEQKSNSSVTMTNNLLDLAEHSGNTPSDRSLIRVFRRHNDYAYTSLKETSELERKEITRISNLDKEGAKKFKKLEEIQEKIDKEYANDKSNYSKNNDVDWADNLEVNGKSVLKSLFEED